MIKKISAIVLALVLCLSVVVVPVSAVELGDAKQAFEVKFDKEYYNAGDTAIVSVYAKVAEGYEIGGSWIVVGFNSAVFAQADNNATDIKSSLVLNDVATTYFKEPASLTVQWAPTAQANAMNSANTAEEQALYDEYLKISLVKNTTSGLGTKNGFPSEELNADEAPIVQFELKVAEGLADGTPISASVTTGVISKTQGYMGYYSNPGNSATVAKFAVADTVLVGATATVGKATPKLTIVKDKTQINFDPDQNGYYEGKFAIRQFVEFDNLLDVFGTPAEAKDGADGTGLTEVGFVYATTDKYNKTDALAVIDAGASSGAYTLDNDAYISTTAKAGSYVMGYTVNNIADASVSLTILAYAKYEVNGKEDIATIEIAGDYSDIYEQFESKIDLLKKPVTE